MPNDKSRLEPYFTDPKHPAGRWLKALGKTLVGIGSILFLVLLTTQDQVPLWKWLVLAMLALVGAAVMKAVGGIAYGLGAGLTSKRADQIEPAVLYLRSFDTDSRVGRFDSVADLEAGNFEEGILRAVASVGEAIALRRPGNPLPPAGASRKTVSDEAWQDAVVHYMRTCALTVLYYDTVAGPNVQWEVETMFREVPPSRRIVVFRSAEGARAFFETAKAHFSSGGLEGRLDLDDLHYMGFDAAGQPILLEGFQPPVVRDFGPPDPPKGPGLRDYLLSAQAEASNTPSRPAMGAQISDGSLGRSLSPRRRGQRGTSERRT